MDRNSHASIPWQGSAGVPIPVTAKEVSDLKPFAWGIKEHEITKLIKAFDDNFYDMGTQFIWQKAMSRLKGTISQLGMRFVGEMLDREDIDEYSTPENVLTDYDSIRLAEALGIIDSTGSMLLRHGLETITHFSADDTEDELAYPEAFGIVKACIKYVLGIKNMSVAVDFSNFRKKLTTTTIVDDDPQIDQLVGSPPFFLSTTLRVLLASIKSEEGPQLEHVIANVNLLLPKMWEDLSEKDRWSVGTTYAEVSTEGKPVVQTGIKRALLKVSGFDYVPENLRSNTYKKAAQAVLVTHRSMNNFHHEPIPTRRLAQLGSTIPLAAFAECMQAYLSVYLGNAFGHSWGAQPIAEKELCKLPTNRWELYLSKILPQDEEILFKLTESKPASNFCDLVILKSIDELDIGNTFVERLVKYAAKKKTSELEKVARGMLEKMRNS